MIINSEWVENWRAQVVYKPAVLKQLARAEQEHGRSNWRTKEDVELYVKSMKQRHTGRTNMDTFFCILLGAVGGGCVSLALALIVGLGSVGPNGDAFMGQALAQIHVFVFSLIFTVPIGIGVAFGVGKSKDD